MIVSPMRIGHFPDAYNFMLLDADIADIYVYDAARHATFRPPAAYFFAARQDAASI